MCFKPKDRMPGFQMLLIIFLFSISASPCNSDVTFDPFVSVEDTDRPMDSNHSSGSGPVIPQVNFNNNNISMPFQIISDATGWSIFPTEQVTSAKISLWAKNISAKELLDKVVAMAGFIYHRKGDVITVMTYDEYRQHYGLAKKIFTLKYADATSINSSLKPFLSKLAKSVVHKERNKIVIYETDANLKFIAALIEKLDTALEDIIFEVIPLRYCDCKDVAKILQSAFSKATRAPRSETLTQPAERATEAKKSEKKAEVMTVPKQQVEIYPVSNANQLMVVGTESDIRKVNNIVSKIDVRGKLGLLEVMTLRYADSKMVAETLQKLFSERKSQKEEQSPFGTAPEQRSAEESDEIKSEFKDTLRSPESSVKIFSIGRTNQLLVKAHLSDLESVKDLVQKLDTYIEPVTRNYHLTYVDASEVYKGLHQVLNISRSMSSPSSEAGRGSFDVSGKMEGLMLIKNTNSIVLTASPAAHRIMSSIVENSDSPGRYKGGMIEIYKLDNADVQEAAQIVKDMLRKGDAEKPQTKEMKYQRPEAGTEKPWEGTEITEETEEFISQIESKVSVSKAKNSLIVQATAREHRELSQLIRELDKRQRQVLIEARIVELTDSDNLNLGVELGHSSKDASFFTSFGLSSNLEPRTGLRDITVSAGGTAAVLRPDKVEGILQMLRTKGNARITSAPQLLVNDNAVGSINSIAEEPTTQTNQGETSTTTSFAGFVQAGTQFAITPHISEEDYLRVQYQITLNSFGTKPTDPSIPPPRNTSSIQSEATIPDGYTIVVGGLRTTDESENIDKVPFLGDIPVLEWAFKNTKTERRYKTTYLFITPTIIKRRDFTDLKDVSDDALEKIERDRDYFSETKELKGGVNRQASSK